MAYGVQTWAANGSPNNFGVKPVSVITSILLNAGQKTGSWTFSVSPGLKLNYYHVNNDSSGNGNGLGRRKVTISGNTITVSSAGDSEYAANTFRDGRAFLIVTAESA